MSASSSRLTPEWRGMTPWHSDTTTLTRPPREYGVYRYCYLPEQGIKPTEDAETTTSYHDLLGLIATTHRLTIAKFKEVGGN